MKQQLIYTYVCGGAHFWFCSLPSFRWQYRLIMCQLLVCFMLTAVAFNYTGCLMVTLVVLSWHLFTLPICEYMGWTYMSQCPMWILHNTPTSYLCNKAYTYTIYDKNCAKRKFSPISPVDVNGENFFVEHFLPLWISTCWIFCSRTIIRNFNRVAKTV